MTTCRNNGVELGQKKQNAIRSAVRKAAKQITENRMEFGEALVMLRKLTNLNQDDLAIEIGVTRSAVTRWETNRALPRENLIKDIENFFDLKQGVLRNAAIRSNLK